MRYFEEYRCGCVSKMVAKKDLAGYCETHGADTTHVYKSNGDLMTDETAAPHMAHKQCLETVAQLTQANRELSTTIQTLRNDLAGRPAPEPETINPYCSGFVQPDPGRP